MKSFLDSETEANQSKNDKIWVQNAKFVGKRESLNHFIWVEQEIQVEKIGYFPSENQF